MSRDRKAPSRGPARPPERDAGTAASGPGAARVYDGSCLCGEVRYRVAGPFERMTHCHCTDCRKAHAAAFATFVTVSRRRFALLAGEDLLRRHTAASASVRSFCGGCGSILTWEAPRESGTIDVAAATFDTPLERTADHHLFVRSKVPWFEILDGLPQHATLRGAG